MATAEENGTHPFMSSPESWAAVHTSLAVTKKDLDPERVSGVLGLPSPGAPGERPGFDVHAGPHWWSYTCHEPFSADLGEQISALTALLVPLRPAIAELRSTGHGVQIAIAGTPDPGNVLSVPPEGLSLLATLSLPVSFTTLTPDNAPAEDPLAWLDE
jgi:hypothetical protein